MTATPVTPLERPKRLTEGDRVVIASPSGPAPHDRIEAGTAILRSWGLDVVVAPHAGATSEQFSYLAGDDEARAADFEAAWCDPDVAAVVCARGGYGVQRMVDRLDWAAMRAAGPKVLVGYSDITALHSAVATHLGLVSLHGPMSATEVFLNDEASPEHLRRTLFEPESVQELGPGDAHTLVGGRAQGVTVGGCLSLLAGELGTPTGVPSAAGGLLLLEDVDEKAYRIDGYLTHLRRAGWLDGVNGVVLGSWQGCEPVEDLVVERLGDLGVPIVGNFGFGHCPSTITVPLGIPATLDADASTLRFDVPALA
ncbi:S66 peptidase family protein [Knoellia subterranea]|uniref:Peptidase U61 n=1 Tax=Knoellia subterranea KCTC 19937 TaxID=1385521 RepID=A0A0A0JPF2_9MICO|nr:LD-carboxypeptidase [Knoellia subterranea]KGN37932.1 peptidase U61 [Knoellia subterranea KCTC 19937]